MECSRWPRQWRPRDLGTLLLPLSAGFPWGCDAGAGMAGVVLMTGLLEIPAFMGGVPRLPSSFCLWKARVGGRP